MRNLRARIGKLEKRTEPDGGPSIIIVYDEATRREAEARREAARARGERVVRVTVGGIDLENGI